MSDWHAIVVRGTERELRAFVVGFLADAQLDGAQVRFGDDVGLEPASLGDRLRDLVGAGGHHVVLVPHAHVEPLLDALWRKGPAIGLEVTDRYVVRQAWFRFATELFSPEVAQTLKTTLFGLPEGVTIEDRHEEEETHPDGRGVELYAPVHTYELRLSGRVVGGLDGVLEVRGRLSAIEAVRVEGLHLEQAA